MNILIMGCSWGVPNYFGPPGDPCETHIEFLLRRQGHIVFNCAINGGSNLRSLERAKDLVIDYKFIDHPSLPNHFIGVYEDPKIDLVIWFHTDPGRELRSENIIDVKNKSTGQQLDELCTITYKEYNNFFQKLNAKIIVIGGCTDINPVLYNLIEPNFVIESWQKVLLGKSCRTWEIRTGLNIPDDNDMEIVNETLEVVKLMDNHRDLFPDGGHPGGKAHLDLFNYINENFVKLTPG